MTGSVAAEYYPFWELTGHLLKVVKECEKPMIASLVSVG